MAPLNFHFQNRLLNHIVAGAIAGCFGTLPMTLFMRAAQRTLPANERYPLPPERVTANAARTVGLHPEPHAPGWELKTYLGHFAYGTAVGAIYAILFDPRATPSDTSSAKAQQWVPTATRGAAFGLAVWLVSYLGWLPVAKLHRSATHEPAGRNTLMIVAHLVWGGATALVLRALHSRSD